LFELSRTLDGQLRVESKEGEGSKFTFVLPFRLPSQDALRPSSSIDGTDTEGSGTNSSRTISARGTSQEAFSNQGRAHSTNSTGSIGSKGSKGSSTKSDIDSLIAAISTSHMEPHANANARPTKSPSVSSRGSTTKSGRSLTMRKAGSNSGEVELKDTSVPLRAVKVPSAMATPEEVYPARTRLHPSTSRSGALAGRPVAKWDSIPGAPLSPSSPSSPAASPRPIGVPLTSEQSPASTSRPGQADGMALGSPKHVSEYKLAATAAAEEEDPLPSMRVLVVEVNLLSLFSCEACELSVISYS
jgi:hypothetical protein